MALEGSPVRTGEQPHTGLRNLHSHARLSNPPPQPLVHGLVQATGWGHGKGASGIATSCKVGGNPLEAGGLERCVPGGSTGHYNSSSLTGSVLQTG